MNRIGAALARRLKGPGVIKKVFHFGSGTKEISAK